MALVTGVVSAVDLELCTESQGKRTLDQLHFTGSNCFHGDVESKYPPSISFAASAEATP